MPTLVVNQGAIGDLLLSLPALRLLRRERGEFTLAAMPYQGLFLKNAGEVSSVIPANASAFSELYVGKIPPLLKYFDDIWWFTRRRGLVPDIFLRPSQDWSSQIVFTVDEGPDRTNCALFQFNQIQRLLQLENQTIEDFLYPMSFSRNRQDRKLFDLAVHPGSGSQKKCWPVDNFIQTVETLLSEHRIERALFILGPAEKPIEEKIKRFVLGQNGHALYMQQQDLLMVADTLGQTRCFLGNDSGISHLAAWCGANSFLLFGPTEPSIWKPPLQNATIIKSPAKCSPCGDAYRRCQDTHCMDELPASEVCNALVKVP